MPFLLKLVRAGPSEVGIIIILQLETLRHEEMN